MLVVVKRILGAGILLGMLYAALSFMRIPFLKALVFIIITGAIIATIIFAMWLLASE